MRSLRASACRFFLLSLSPPDKAKCSWDLFRSCLRKKRHRKTRSACHGAAACELFPSAILALALPILTPYADSAGPLATILTRSGRASRETTLLVADARTEACCDRLRRRARHGRRSRGANP
jgi:hypothetical protein